VLLTRAGIGEVIGSSELNTTLDTYKALHNVVIGSLVVSVAGLLPGYYATFFLIDTPGWGRKRIQLLGFAMLTVLLAILGKVIPSIRGRFSVKLILEIASDSWHLSWS
jgi:PHS family inorganic phosphate transporter-like MFS transporter